MRKHVLVGAVCVLFLSASVFLVRFGFDGFPRYGWMKMALATGYLLLAVLLGAPDTRLGRWLLAGFACAWWGDFFLIGPGNGFFLAGLVAFLLGHLCYCAAYAVHGARWRVALLSYLVLACPGAVLLRYLWPGIPGGLGVPVLSYVAVITLMVSLSIGCVGRPAGGLLLAGAVLFYLSDMGVSSHAFGGERMDPFKELVKLYFPAQYLLVLAIPVARRAAAKSVAGS